MTETNSSLLGPVAAVIVTYHIGESIRETVNSIIHQVDSVILVDNGSSAETLAILRSLCGGRIRLIEREENNLAAAQNAGIEAARAQGAVWVLLADHDSLFGSEMIAAMEKCLMEFHRRVEDQKIALLAPALYDRNSTRPPRYLRCWGKYLFKRTGFGGRPYLDDVMCAIASGSLIKLSVIDAVGGMDESFVIDDVDREFCLRLVTRGYQIVAVRDAVLHHQIGQCRDHRLLGVCVTTSNHDAARRRTIYRNRLRNWKRYGRSLPGFILFDAAAMLYDLVRLLTCEEHKAKKFHAILNGVKEGLA